MRGTVRASKLASTKKDFAFYGDAVEIVVANDLINGSFPEIFEGMFCVADALSSCSDSILGVDAVIHTAAPLLGKEATAEAALDVCQVCVWYQLFSHLTTHLGRYQRQPERFHTSREGWRQELLLYQQCHCSFRRLPSRRHKQSRRRWCAL